MTKGALILVETVELNRILRENLAIVLDRQVMKRVRNNTIRRT